MCSPSQFFRRPGCRVQRTLTGTISIHSFIVYTLWDTRLRNISLEENSRWVMLFFTIRYCWSPDSLISELLYTFSGERGGQEFPLSTSLLPSPTLDCLLPLDFRYPLTHYDVFIAFLFSNQCSIYAQVSYLVVITYGIRIAVSTFNRLPSIHDLPPC